MNDRTVTMPVSQPEDVLKISETPVGWKRKYRCLEVNSHLDNRFVDSGILDCSTPHGGKSARIDFDSSPSRSFNGNISSNSDLSILLALEPYDLEPKTDYTYARSPIYREFGGQTVKMPNMSRLPLNTYQQSVENGMLLRSGSQLSTPSTTSRLGDFQDLTDSQHSSPELRQSVRITESYREDRSVINSNLRNRSTNNSKNRDRSSYNSQHLDKSTINSKQLNSSSYNSKHIDKSTINSHLLDRSTKNSQLMDRSTNNSQLMDRSTNNSKQQKEILNNNNVHSSYNQYSTYSRTVREEYDNSHLNGNIASPRMELFRDRSSSTSVRHMYGLDHNDDSFSDSDGEGHTEVREAASYNSGDEKSVTNTIVTTVTTTIETVSSVVRPVTTCVGAICRPIWSTATSLLSWMWLSVFARQYQETTSSSSHKEEYRQKRRGLCACLCPCLLALLFLSLLPLVPMFLGLFGAGNYTEQAVLPPVINQTFIHLRREVRRYFTPLYAEKNNNTEEVERVCRKMIESTVDGMRQSILYKNEQSANARMEMPDCKKTCTMPKLDDFKSEILLKIQLLQEQFQAFMVTNKLNEDSGEKFRLEIMNEVDALKSLVSEMEGKIVVLSQKINQGADQVEIRRSVDIVLKEIIANYEDNPNADGFAAWIKDNFASKDQFQIELQKLSEDLSLKLASFGKERDQRAEHDKQEQGNTQYIIQSDTNVNATFIKTLIDDALWKFAADKTGLADYALENGGAEVLSIRCSKTVPIYNKRISLFGIPLYYPTNSPSTAVKPSTGPGDCWPFEGNQGYLVIKLSRTIIPTSVSIEHIPRDISPHGDIRSAPSDFTILALKDETDIEGISLGNYTYSKDGPPLQYFPIKLHDPPPMRFIELRILDNHGMKTYTCLYRFRVHGTPLDGVDKLFE